MAILGHFWPENGHFLGGAALKHPFFGFNTMQHMLFCVKHQKNRVGGSKTEHPSPKTLLFCPKLAIFGHFWPENARFLGRAALQHPFSGFNTMQHMFFRVKNLKNRVGGPWPEHPGPLFFCPKLAILGHFWPENGHFLGGADLKHLFSGFHTMQLMFFRAKHVRNRVGGA